MKAWLVERADPNNSGCVLPDSFLGVDGSADHGYGSFRWMKTADFGLRFPRRVDAELFIAAARTQAQNAGFGLPGFGPDDPPPVAVEHAWS